MPGAIAAIYCENKDLTKDYFFNSQILNENKKYIK